MDTMSDIELEFVEAERIPFDVVMIQVTIKNIEKLADWCGGTVVEHHPYKMMGSTSLLPALRLPAPRPPKKGPAIKRQPSLVLIGQWIVEHNGSFRMYREEQLKETFRPKIDLPLAGELVETLKVDEFVKTPQHGLFVYDHNTTVRVIDKEADTYGFAGKVLSTEADSIQGLLVTVDFGPELNILGNVFRVQDLEVQN